MTLVSGWYMGEEDRVDIEALLRSNRDEIVRIAASHGVHNVRIFGSVARGEARPDSDLDLLVQLEPGHSLLDLIAVKQALEDLLGCEVDVVTKAAVSPYIRKQVVEEAAS